MDIPIIPDPSVFDYKGINLFDIPGINKVLGIDPRPLKQQVDDWFKFEKILESEYEKQKKYIRIKK